MKAPSQRRGRQSGFSLIELMVAITISLFIIGGLASLFVSMKLTFRSQDQFAQLEDGERLASTMLTQTVRAAGYFPSPNTVTAATALPAVSGTFGSMVVGQSLSGSTGSDGDVMTVRYATASGDGLMNCLGQTNGSGALQTQLNTYRVAAGSNTLSCSTDGGITFIDLVGGVASMSILYCVDTNAGGGATTGPNRYLSAGDVTTLDLWSSVYAVKLTLQFVNPLAAQPNQPATLPWVLAIDVMAST